MVVPGITLAKSWNTKSIITVIVVAVAFGLLNALTRYLMTETKGMAKVYASILHVLFNIGLMLVVGFVCRQMGLTWGLKNATMIQQLITAAEGGAIVAAISMLA